MSVALRVTSNLPEVEREIERMATAIPVAARLALGEVAESEKTALVDSIRKRTPVGKEDRGVHLRDTTEGSATLTSSTTAVVEARQTKTVGPENVPLTVLLTGGTAPHEIVPRTAQALHWTDASGEHFARRVHHPGTKPVPYIAEAMAGAEPMLRAIEEKAGEAISRSVLEVLR